mmetsp:Transcript_11768/g.35371  ORF Transcript_11768/g.35371 Transcript_11768/m.35371 type:complete len:208 (-) Transcript_11768:869-1492(-)
MEFRLSSELSVGEIKLFVNCVILPFMDVWEAVERKVSYPKQCKYSYPIPTAADIKFWQGLAKADFLNKYANELQQHGLIEDCDRRTCISQAMATHKADAAPGIFRFVTDCRKVNEFTVDDHMGLPFIWDLAYELAGCKVRLGLRLLADWCDEKGSVQNRLQGARRTRLCLHSCRKPDGSLAGLGESTIGLQRAWTYPKAQEVILGDG